MERRTKQAEAARERCQQEKIVNIEYNKIKIGRRRRGTKKKTEQGNAEMRKLDTVFREIVLIQNRFQKWIARKFRTCR